MLEALPRRKFRDQIVDRLKHLIAAEALVPGDRLPTENELAERFGVSRLSVREATKSLEFLGVLEARTGVGLIVRQLDLASVTQHLGFHPALHRADPIQLIESRIILETGVLPHVARRMATDPTIYVSLRELADRFRTVRDLHTWIELDIRLHRALLEASGLEPLVAFGELLQVFFRRFRDSVKRAEWKRGIESHERILGLLRDQKVEDATAELRRHIASHKDRLEARP